MEKKKPIKIPRTLRELNQAELKDIVEIDGIIQKKIDSIITKEDKKVFKKIEHLKDFPYMFALNSYMFTPGKEKEAKLKEKELKDLNSSYKDVRSRILKGLSQDEVRFLQLREMMRKTENE